MEISHPQSNALLTSDWKNNFEAAFKTHFKGLHAYAFTVVKDSAIAEEIVQQTFFKIWEKRDELSIETSLTAYLYKTVYNHSLNHLKHEKVKQAYQAHTVHHMKNNTDNAEKKVLLTELQQKISVALSELPEQCRTIFQMSRFEELKYSEIAQRLGISPKTVENQMGKALKLLRVKLVEYLPIILIILPNLLIQ
jgi:RNA polymerase sigma-70 factor (ECF subfamily)